MNTSSNKCISYSLSYTNFNKLFLQILQVVSEIFHEYNDDILKYNIYINLYIHIPSYNYRLIYYQKLIKFKIIFLIWRLHNITIYVKWYL